MRESCRPIAKEFEALAADLDANGLERYYFPTEMWFYPEGLKELKRRADTPKRVDDAQPDEIKFSEIFYKHFPNA